MMRVTGGIIRRWLDALLHIADTPERTAAAFALGVFFSFSPFFGLHTVLALAFAFLLDLNRVAALLGVCSNLPWVVGPYYAFTTVVVGAPLTRHRIPPGSGARLAALFERPLFDREFWHSLYRLLSPLLWPYAVGSFVGAIVLAATAYLLALAFVTSRRRLQHMIHTHKP